MASRTRQGRAVPARKGPQRALFLGLIAIVGLIGTVLLVIALRTSPAEEPLSAISSAPLSVPTGQTSDGAYMKGAADAPVVVTEYADFQCPGCGYYARSLASAFDRAYVETGKVQFVYRDYPLAQHPNAIPAAEAARCAGDQGSFWQMSTALFANQRQWSSLANPTAQFGAYAQELKLDSGRFAECLASGVHQAAVVASRSAAESLGLTGTPSFAVNGVVVDTTGAQSVDDIIIRVQAAIDAELVKQ
jgi:protein-disulfide isomerase